MTPNNNNNRPRPPFVSTAFSRERNRVHAQRTRQRKKEQMQSLQNRATELKEEQIRLQRVINEKTTASILVHMFAEGCVPSSSDTDENDSNDVDKILERSPEDIPDPSQIPELPTLVLPGQHASKKLKAQAVSAVVPHSPSDPSETAAATTTTPETDNPEGAADTDGIDYALLGRDRSQCTSEELDAIRRERNRMHAKRTRDRKRFFTEQLAELCRQLEDENLVLHKHLQSLDPAYTYDAPTTTTATTTTTTTTAISPLRRPHKRQRTAPTPPTGTTTTTTTQQQQQEDDTVTFDLHISTLLRAAASQQTDATPPPPNEVSSCDDSGDSSS